MTTTSSYDNNLTMSGYRPHPMIVAAAFAIIVLGAAVGLVRGFLMTDRTPRSMAASEAGVSATQAAPSDQRIAPGDFLMAEPAAEEELEPAKTEVVENKPIPKTEVAPPPVAQTVQAIIEAPVAAPAPPPAPVTAEVLY